MRECSLSQAVQKESGSYTREIGGRKNDTRTRVTWYRTLMDEAQAPMALNKKNGKERADDKTGDDSDGRSQYLK